METRPAEQRDLLAVWPNLAKRMTDEYQLADVPPGKARGMFRDWIKAGTADAVLLDGHPVAIMAWQIGEEQMVTSFAGSDAFFHPRLVRPFAKYIANLQRTNGNRALISYSYSAHPQVIKWFATLGFELKSEAGLSRVFVLYPR